MSEENKLLQLLEQYDVTRGPAKFDVLISLRKFLQRSSDYELMLLLKGITELRHLRALLAAGPRGHVYKAVMARLYAVESGAV